MSKIRGLKITMIVLGSFIQVMVENNQYCTYLELLIYNLCVQDALYKIKILIYIKVLTAYF